MAKVIWKFGVAENSQMAVGDTYGMAWQGVSHGVAMVL
jgi:hypothetical protein